MTETTVLQGPTTHEETSECRGTYRSFESTYGESGTVEAYDDGGDGHRDRSPEDDADSQVADESCAAKVDEESPDNCDESHASGDVSPLDEKPAEELTAQELGKRGEDAAVRYLKLNGYEIIERNWKCRFGEVDIIARDEDDVVCFIEVKTRRSIEAGIPEEAVTPDKQRRYEKIALSYMIGAEWDDGVNVRFDTIGICVTGNRRALLRHHKGCFDGLF